MVISKAELKHSASCGAASFTATYTFNSPKPLYLERPSSEQAAGELRLCKTSEHPCAMANTYPVGTTIKGEASDFKIALNTGENITCGNATLSAEVQSLGAPLPVGVQYAFSKCAGPVESTCTATSELSSGTFSYNSKLEIPISFEDKAIWDFNCNSPFISMHCAYDGLGRVAYLPTGKVTTIKYEGLELHKTAASNAVCPEKSFVTVHYTVTSPTPLYLTTT
jgi:hypothetical protein